MHILISVLGIAGAFGYYWFVFRRAGDAVGELVDSVGRARGAYRRNQFRRKAEESTIHAIDDPRTAAVVMAVAVAGPEGAMSAEQEEALKRAMIHVIGVEDPVEELIFAKWAAAEVNDPDLVSRQLSRLWRRALTVNERRQLADIVANVAAVGGDLSRRQAKAIRSLRARLDLS